MPTSNDVHPARAAERGSLRLRLTDVLSRHDHLDGGWWPRSRDLSVELADLIDHFPQHFGRVGRVLVSPPDWEPSPRRLPVRGRMVKVGSFPSDDTHLICLTTSDGTYLRLLVVPHTFNEADGSEALLAASTRGNAFSATELLREVTDQPEVDPYDQWHLDGARTT